MTLTFAKGQQIQQYLSSIFSFTPELHIVPGIVKWHLPQREEIHWLHILNKPLLK